MKNKYVMTFEAYQTYSKYGNASWATPSEMLNDATITVMHALPTFDKKWLANADEQSDDNKGIKFEFNLMTGDTIHAIKVGAVRGQWELYLNKKKMKSEDIKKILIDKTMTDLEQWEAAWRAHDQYYNYSDSNDVYKSGSAAEKSIIVLYNKLSSSDKKKAYKIYSESGMDGIVSFPEFKGV